MRIIPLHARQLTHTVGADFVIDASTLQGLGIVLQNGDIIRVTNKGTRDYHFSRNIFTGIESDRELCGWVYAASEGGTVTVFNT